MSDIALIAPYENLAAMALEVSRSIRKPVRVERALLGEAPEVARRLKKEGVQVLISRGGTALMLQDAPDLGLPVVEIRVTAYDVVRAVAKAKLFGRRIGIVGFENMVLGASTLGEAMEVEIKELVLEHARDADDMVRAAIQGGVGLAAGANLNPERKYPSMFEPIHGSAPDIAGKGIANPIATIWAAAMMLDFLGYEDMGSLVISAVEQTLLKDAPKPVDLGGTASTSEMGDAVCESLYRLAG